MDALMNLNNLHEEEKAVRAKTYGALSSSSALKDHFEAVQDAMDHLTTLLEVPTVPGSELHTFQLLSMRLFNVGASTLTVGFSGYYQAAFQLLRDALEVVNLLDLFRIAPPAVARWMAVTDRRAGKEFEPFKVREALEKHPDFAKQRRDHIYSTYSNMALHPSYMGFRLIAPQNTPRLGPFFDLALFTALLEDLAAHLSHAALAAGLLIEELPQEIMVAKLAFMERLDVYRKRYIATTSRPILKLTVRPV